MNPPVIHYRISHWMYYHHMSHLSRIYDWIGRMIYSCFVPGQAKIEKNFSLAYWGLGLIVHTQTQIGDNCKLGQMTIGCKAGGVPRLLKNVYVGQFCSRRYHAWQQCDCRGEFFC